MRRIDKAYLSAWILLSVFVPMVLLSAMHIHPQVAGSDVPCHECMEHTVHNGHITTLKVHIDCFLCAFHNNVFQPQEQAAPQFRASLLLISIDNAMPALPLGHNLIKSTRAPPYRRPTA